MPPQLCREWRQLFSPHYSTLNWLWLVDGVVRSFQSFIHCYSRYLSNSNTLSHSELSEIEVKKVGSFDSHNGIEAIPNHSQLKTQSRQHANAVENRKKGALNSSFTRHVPMWKIVLNVNWSRVRRTFFPATAVSCHDNHLSSLTVEIRDELPTIKYV